LCFKSRLKRKEHRITHSSDDESKKYASFSGASLSAPMLTGVIALIMEQSPHLTNKDITSFFTSYDDNKFDTVKILQDFKKIN